ncbi:MAG: DUF917 domain-containing protein, partial [Lentisphaeria bacterium]|nr:DUF917 domain-containing protein [Lentisphaeria bacterium]
MSTGHYTRTLSQDDLDRLLWGVCVLGTGGGGDPRRGRAQIDMDLERGRDYRLVDVERVDDDALIVSGGFMGHMEMRASWADTIERWEVLYELERAVRTMERYLGRSVDYLVPFELGGGNTIAILSCAARLGIPVVDGDGIGRAAPETQMSSFFANGVSLTPMTLYDEQGGAAVVDGGDSFFPDDVGRFVVTRCGGRVANCHYPMSGEALRRSVVRGTLSDAIVLGERLERAQAESACCVDVAAKTLDANVHLVGRVALVTERTDGGFFFSEVQIRGIGEYEGHSMTLRNN